MITATTDVHAQRARTDKDESGSDSFGSSSGSSGFIWLNTYKNPNDTSGLNNCPSGEGDLQQRDETIESFFSSLLRSKQEVEMFRTSLQPSGDVVVLQRSE